MNVLISILIGLALGFITGLIPGLHPNFIGSILLFQFSDWWILPTFVTMIVSYQFFEIIRSTFLFVPDESNVLAMHPIFRFVHEGKSLAAIKLITVGILSALLTGVVLSPVLIKFVPFLYDSIRKYVPFGLLIIMGLLIIKDRKPLYAIIIFLMSGVVGYFGLKMLNQPLMILLTGFFGFPILLEIRQKLPKQIKSYKIPINKKDVSKGLGSAFLSSFFLTFIPAVGPAQASLFSRWMLKKKEEFLISIGAISGFDIVFSTILLFTVGKARIGVIEMLGQKFSFDIKTFVLVLLTTVTVGIISYILTLHVGKLFANLENRINYTWIKIIVVLAITAAAFFFDGVLGIAFLAAASGIGVLANKVKTSMSNCMGSLVVPTLLYYF